MSWILSRECKAFLELRKSVFEAREIAASIRLNWDASKSETERDRKAATLLLTLADEIERLRPELRVETETH